MGILTHKVTVNNAAIVTSKNVKEIII